MRFLLLLTFVLTCISGFAQQDTSVLVTDTPTVISRTQVDSPVYSGYDEKNNTRNLLAIVKMQNKRRAQEKQAAMLRIGLGVGFFVVLVIGLMRRRRKK